MKRIMVQLLTTVYFLMGATVAFGMLNKNKCIRDLSKYKNMRFTHNTTAHSLLAINKLNKVLFKQNHLVAQYHHDNQLKEMYERSNQLYEDVNDKAYGPNWGFLLQQENEQTRQNIHSQLQDIYDEHKNTDIVLDKPDVPSMLVQRTKAIIEQNHLLFEYYRLKQDLRFNERYRNSCDQKTADAIDAIEVKMFYLYKKCGVDIRSWDDILLDTKDSRRLHKKTNNDAIRIIVRQNKNIIQFNHLLSNYDDCKQVWRYHKDYKDEREKDSIRAQSLVQIINKKHLLKPFSVDVKECDSESYDIIQQNNQILDQKLFLLTYHYYCLFLFRRNNFEKDELLFYPEKNIYVSKLTGCYGSRDEIICDHENIFTASDGLLACLERSLDDIYKSNKITFDREWLHYSTMSRK